MEFEGVQYTCVMNDEEMVTKLSLVAISRNHRYLIKPPGILSGLYSLFFKRSDDAFDIEYLTKLKSLNYLYLDCLTKALREYRVFRR